ncbi:MAG: cupin domain-containing protein [Chloroflexi bacterium]|nr:cupin domain-containing protein [Chloroflexota bacterium]MCL5076478.1 cupin domain-containing protein [Chloroflexota bacterium]
MAREELRGRAVRLADVRPRLLDTTNYMHRGDGRVSDLLTPERAGTKNMILGTSVYNPGSVTWAKIHNFEEAVYVVSGRGIFYVEEEAISLEPGTALFIPPGARHNIENNGTEPLVFIFAAAPPPALAPTFPDTQTSSRRVDV